jgi:hypothetical protein
VIDLIVDENSMNGPKGIPLKNRIISEVLPSEIHNHLWIKDTQPTILCHDQEPLNFDFYSDESPLLEEFIEYKQKKNIALSPTNKDLNLRYIDTWAWQEKWILLHSELNSQDVEKYEQTGLFQCAYWWSHAILSRDWYRYAEHDRSLLSNDSPKKLFLIYCRDMTGSREYRQRFLESLDNDLEKNCQIGSFDGRKAQSHFSAEYDADDLTGTGISIVLETIFENSRIHLTEKTLRPLACRHPFILAAGPGSLGLLRKYGFKTFAPWIDESYDEIADPNQRLDAIVREMKRITMLSNSELQKTLTACRSIASDNQTHFFSRDFYDIVIEELKENVSAAHGRIGDRLDPRLYLENYSWNYRDQPGFSIKPSVQKAADLLLEQNQRHQNSLHDKTSPDGNDV